MFHFGPDQPYVELPDWAEDEQLRAAMTACIEAQRDPQIAAGDAFRAHVHPEDEVSEAALRKILATGEDIHGIASDSNISNVVCFGAAHIRDAIHNERVNQLRREMDALVQQKVWQTFDAWWPLEARCSGHFWYPAGGYMGWHTNRKAPGWRIYLTCAEEAGKSFFRYRDPATDQVVTSTDQHWDARMFLVDPKQPLWHCVYSATNRYSFGYVVRRRKIAGATRRWLSAWGGALPGVGRSA